MKKVRVGSVRPSPYYFMKDLLRHDRFISALKIHVSPVTKEILDQFGTFVLTLRGPVEMKVCYLFCFSEYMY